MAKRLISDTCDVVFKRLTDGAIVFTGEASLASVSQKIKEEKVRGGIGSKVLAILRSEKEIDLKVDNAIYDTTWLEMVSGTKFVNGTTTVWDKTTDIKCITLGELPFTGTPIAGSITVLDKKGDKVGPTATFAAGKITCAGVLKDEIYTVVSQKTTAGMVLPIKNDVYSEAYSVEYHTVEYDLVTNKVTADIYWQFDKVLPSSQFDISFETGKALGSTVSLSVLAPLNAGSEVGRVIEVIRA